MLSKGREFLEEGRFEDALAFFEASSDSRSRFGRAVALHLLGRFEQAEAAYEQVLAADPKHAETLANLIGLNVERFDLPRVEQYCQRLLEVVADSAIALRGLIVVAVERCDYARAARYYARLTPDEERSRDTVEYRLSWHIVDRLREHHVSVAHPY